MSRPPFRRARKCLEGTPAPPLMQSPEVERLLRGVAHPTPPTRRSTTPLATQPFAGAPRAGSNRPQPVAAAANRRAAPRARQLPRSARYAYRTHEPSHAFQPARGRRMTVGRGQGMEPTTGGLQMRSGASAAVRRWPSYARSRAVRALPRPWVICPCCCQLCCRPCHRRTRDG